jgi:STE24 endopeptidase
MNPTDRSLPRERTSFSLVFAVFVVAALAWRTWLALRQARHVAAHRDERAGRLRRVIPLERTARRPTTRSTSSARARRDLAVDGVVLLALTLGGGIAAIDALGARSSARATLRELATVFGVLLASTLATLPFDLWRTFVIEERHGFNRMTPRLFALDLAKGMRSRAASARRCCSGCSGCSMPPARLWWLYTGSRGWRSRSFWWSAVPALDRAALQPLHAARGGPAARAHRGAHRAAAASTPRACS